MGVLGTIRRVFGAGEEDRPYRCLGCDSRFAVQYHACPECGGFAVEREYGSGADVAGD